MIKTTRQQREALFQIFQRDFPGWLTPTTRTEHAPCPKCGHFGAIVKVPSLQYRAFLRKCVPEGCSFGAVMVPWRSMWLGVEKDGYVHS